MGRQEIETKRIVLAEREVHAEGLCLVYRLEKTETFWIAVDCGAESARCEIGSDLGLAWELFCAMAEGSVTPCVLDELCRDWMYGKSTVRSYSQADL